MCTGVTLSSFCASYIHDRNMQFHYDTSLPRPAHAVSTACMNNKSSEIILTAPFVTVYTSHQASVPTPRIQQLYKPSTATEVSTVTRSPQHIFTPNTMWNSATREFSPVSGSRRCHVRYSARHDLVAAPCGFHKLAVFAQVNPRQPVVTAGIGFNDASSVRGYAVTWPRMGNNLRVIFSHPHRTP